MYIALLDVFFCFSGENLILCPSISLHIVVAEMFPLTASVRRCPNGIELMDDATILMTFIGGGPYILRKPGKQVSLGRGSYMATIEILGTKFGFNTVLTPARSVVAYMGNVRSSYHFILTMVIYYILLSV